MPTIVKGVRAYADQLGYYRLQRSCEGYVFTGVCLSTGGGVSQHALQVVSQHALQQVGGGGIPACLAGGIPACLAAGLQGDACSQRGACSWGVPALGRCLLGGWRRPPPQPADGYCCGRYASDWNAFLFDSMFVCCCFFFFCVGYLMIP